VTHVALRSGIIFSQVWNRSTYPFLTSNVLLLISYVTLWPWPLTPSPWTLLVDRVSCDQTPQEIWAKSHNLRVICWWFIKFVSSLTCYEEVNDVTRNWSQWNLALRPLLRFHIFRSILVMRVEVKNRGYFCTLSRCQPSWIRPEVDYQSLRGIILHQSAELHDKR